MRARAQLNVEHVRRIVPWDLVTRADGDPNTTADDKKYTCKRDDGTEYEVPAPQIPAIHQLHNVDDWIARAQAAGKQVLLTIQKSAAPGADCYLPPDNTYAYAVNRIMERYPSVRWYTAWNEPNDSHQPTHPSFRNGSYDGYTAAGRLWRRASNLCKRHYCKVAAGEFLDNSVFSKEHEKKARKVFDAYMEGAKTNPTIWAWHAYATGRTQKSDRLREFLRRTSPTRSLVDGPRVWLTEQGGRYDLHLKAGRLPREAEANANSNLAYIVSVPAISDRITRLYVYHWRSDGNRTATRVWSGCCGRSERHATSPRDSGTRAELGSPIVGGGRAAGACRGGRADAGGGLWRLGCVEPLGRRVEPLPARRRSR